MKIYPIINNQIKFKANTNKPSPQQFQNHKHDEGNKPLPGWVRKTMLGTLIFFAVKNTPNVQRIINPYEPTQEDLDRTEYYQDVQKMIKPKEKSSSFYQLNQLSDFETPKIKKLDKNTYDLNFELDKQKIDMQIKLNSNSKDTIQGKIKINNSKPQNFKAIFSPDDINEFKVLFNDNENNKIILGRSRFGDLYQIKNNKREYLNQKNIEAFQERQDALEDKAFWDNINPTLRRLNLLVLMFLVFAEMKQDIYDAKRKNLKEELKNKLNNDNNE